MGTLWGATSPVTQHSPTIYADIALAAGGIMPIDPEADERALYLAEGEAIVIHMLVELYARSQDEASDVLESAARGDLAITSLAEESRPPAAGFGAGADSH